VPVGNMGPEMAARTARYAAFKKAVEATGARAVLAMRPSSSNWSLKTRVAMPAKSCGLTPI